MSSRPVCLVFVVSLGIAVFGATAACSSPEAEEKPSAAALVIPASAATKDELGVAEWQIVSADATGIALVGVDEHGTTRADLVMGFEQRGPRGGVLTANV